ncbi:MAG: thioredoxin domain-containing protein [Bacteroidota bacterium]|nr:thioredoxin domain-containing protein [Bacteroidota bacterium]
MPNALAAERSLYLRQHAHNPVNWYPWSEAAFERARQEDKLVFLSIGYSACHWCHVMEKESFEDGEVAALLDQHYIAVKVDREERPDIDALYMSVCQAATGHGGWPLTVILTPDKQVVFIGTYFPKRSTSYRIGLLEILERIVKLWRTNRQAVKDSAANIMQRILPALQSVDAGAISDATCKQVLELAQRSYDQEYSGFGREPKFPGASMLWYLLLWGYISSDRQAIVMVLETLQALRWSGLWDHVGGGFHRYSTDRRWFLPHFEKMLYDQALLLLVYSEAAAITKDHFCRVVVEEIAEALESNFLLPSGVYAASIDADTLAGEGAYYQWTYAELASVLDRDNLDRMCRVFGVTPEGNAYEEATGKSTGRNILYAGVRTASVLERFGGTLEEFIAWWEPIRKHLLSLRRNRPAPLRDEKVLTDWNALAIAALARAGRILGMPFFIQRAERVWKYVEHVHCGMDYTIAHCSYDSVPTVDGFLDDYAFAAWAAVELYQATGNSAYLEKAIALVQQARERFSSLEGIYYTSSTKDIPQITEPSDGATLSGIGVLAAVAAMIALLDDMPDLRNMADSILSRYGGTVSSYPAAHTTLLIAYMIVTRGEKLYAQCSETTIEQIRTILRECYNPLRLWQVLAADYPDMLINATICTNEACSPLLRRLEDVENALKASIETSRR